MTPAAHPQIIAHRGASADRYENTLDAFAQALIQGADAIELDVHRTADGAVVVHHDPVLHIRCKPTGSRALVIAHEPLDALRAVRLRDGSVLPTLDEVCALVGPRAVLYVEIKARELEAAVPAVLARHPTVTAAVHSFDHRVVAGITSALPRGILLSSYLLDVPGTARAAGARDIWMTEQLIDAALIRDAHAAGQRVIAWTVDDDARARELAGLGVDGLCTNRPGALRALLTGAP
jgi:glycerophosphoryl diester phosphodiesterase